MSLSVTRPPLPAEPRRPTPLEAELGAMDAADYARNPMWRVEMWLRWIGFLLTLITLRYFGWF